MSPSFSSSLDRAGRWFLRSGIQEAHGGVARYHRTDIGTNARISTEITGYAASTFVYLSLRTGRPEYAEAAERAARFLIVQAWDPALRLFPFEYPASEPGRDAYAYFFDTGIIIRGLLAGYRLNGNEAWLVLAEEAGTAAYETFLRDGAFAPIIHLPDRQALPFGARWSRGPGCYQLKSALAWYELASASGSERYLRWFEEAVTSALASHRSFLPAVTPEETMDRLHAYGYFLEALLAYSSKANVRMVLSEGIDRVSALLREIAPVFERSDVPAQLLRVRLLADQQADIPLNRALAEDEVRRIAAFQDQGGGYWFGRKAGGFLPFMNPVSTAFCSQALAMWHDHQAGCTLHLRDLI